MGLSCSCDDFDKGECERWWEPGRAGYPAYGDRCCECGAVIHRPGEEKQLQTPICEYAVYEPDGEPRSPCDVDADEMSDDEFNALEREHEKFQDDHGWDSEYDRYERAVDTSWRCERCRDLADSIEDLGYCMIGPGDLPECHVEYVEEHSGKQVMWKRGPDGAYHPRPWTRWDHIRAGARSRWFGARYFVRYGWSLWIKKHIVWPVETKMHRAGWIQQTSYMRASRRSWGSAMK